MTEEVGKYRKKPVVIEAIRWTGLNREKVLKFLQDPVTKEYNGYLDYDENDEDDTSYKFITIETLKGNHRANIGDWIIKGVKGEFYPCKPDIFEQTYERV